MHTGGGGGQEGVRSVKLWHKNSIKHKKTTPSTPFKRIWPIPQGPPGFPTTVRMTSDSTIIYALHKHSCVTHLMMSKLKVPGLSLENGNGKIRVLSLNWSWYFRLKAQTSFPLLLVVIVIQDHNKMSLFFSLKPNVASRWLFKVFFRIINSRV